MIEQFALGVGIFTLCVLAVFYFIPLNVGAYQFWAALVADMKRILAARKKTQ